MRTSLKASNGCCHNKRRPQIVCEEYLRSSVARTPMILSRGNPAENTRHDSKEKGRHDTSEHTQQDEKMPVDSLGRKQYHSSQ